MTDIALNAIDRRELISFRIGDQEFCVDIMDVRELRGWTPTTPLPHAPTFVRGVLNLRGVVLPVVDMSERLGLGHCEAGARHVVIVVCIRDQWVGLLVDNVCDILAVGGAELQPTPEMAGEAGDGLVCALVGLEDRQIGVLSLDNLLPPLANVA